MHLTLLNDNLLLTIGIVLIVFILFIIACYLVDIIHWNNGKCFCGELWYRFDVDSNGERGYKCRKCGKVIWINCPVDKR